MFGHYVLHTGAVTHGAWLFPVDVIEDQLLKRQIRNRSPKALVLCIKFLQMFILVVL